MSIFDEIGKKITDVGQGTAAKAKKFAEITKVNNLIAEREKDLSDLFFQMGKEYYEKNKDTDTEDVLMKKATELYAEIEVYRKQIVELKGMDKCPQCGAPVEAEDLFCKSCGAKIIKEQGEKENVL